MRAWSLGPGDPLFLTISADFRFCTADYLNDHTWELELGGGDPSALSLRTTYGLRARLMRVYPRFTLVKERRSVTDPAVFDRPPRLRHFSPSYLLLDFSPFPGVDVVAEYWVPDSHTCAGRLAVTSHLSEPLAFLLELCGQLAPLNGGQPLALHPLQSVNLLAGRTSGLFPVIFLTGGPQPGPGPSPSLALNLLLQPEETRTFTWSQACLGNLQASLESARLTVARPWEAAIARIDLVDAAQTLEIHTGAPEWDAAFALGQKAAFSLFLNPIPPLPFSSFVFSRRPDSGYSQGGSGSDYPSSWGGQTPLETCYLAGLLPGAPDLAAGLLENFLAMQTSPGFIPWKVGLAGQRGHWLASPLLASLAWRIYQRTRDLEFLRRVVPPLSAFIECWFDAEHDRDADGFPEWDHPLQTGFEDNPAFTVWQAGGQGADISTAESPALASMLYRELDSLARMAEVLDRPDDRDRFEMRKDRLWRLIDDCWNPRAGLYLRRDRDGHTSPAGRSLATQRESGRLELERDLKHPVRLLVRVEWKSEATRRPEVTLHGQNGDLSLTENLSRKDFQWGTDIAAATSRNLYTRLYSVEIAGLDKRDRVSVMVADFSAADITLFLPFWAGLSDPSRAAVLVERWLSDPSRFGGPFGIPAGPGEVLPVHSRADPAQVLELDQIQHSVHMPWNTLVGQGLLACGFRNEAAQLCSHLMNAVIRNLEEQHTFYRAYHSYTAAGIGERNSIHGLPPLGLFLDTLGLRIETPCRLVLHGKNPFPWPVTVKYRGLSVTRQLEDTLVVFPDGRTVTLHDPTEAVVSAD